jgi:hypothetical protein
MRLRIGPDGVSQFYGSVLVPALNLSAGGDLVITDSDGTGAFNLYMDSGVCSIRGDSAPGSAISDCPINFNQGRFEVDSYVYCSAFFGNRRAGDGYSTIQFGGSPGAMYWLLEVASNAWTLQHSSYPTYGLTAQFTQGKLLLGRQDTGLEGGKLAFTRASDGAASMVMDLYGDTFRMLNSGGGGHYIMDAALGVSFNRAGQAPARTLNIGQMNGACGIRIGEGNETTGYFQDIFQSGNDLILSGCGDAPYRQHLGTNDGSGAISFFTWQFAESSYKAGRINPDQSWTIGSLGATIPNYQMSVYDFRRTECYLSLSGNQAYSYGAFVGGGFVTGYGGRAWFGNMENGVANKAIQVDHIGRVSIGTQNLSGYRQLVTGYAAGGTAGERGYIAYFTDTRNPGDQGDGLRVEMLRVVNTSDPAGDWQTAYVRIGRNVDNAGWQSTIDFANQTLVLGPQTLYQGRIAQASTTVINDEPTWYWPSSSTHVTSAPTYVHNIEIQGYTVGEMKRMWLQNSNLPTFTVQGGSFSWVGGTPAAGPGLINFVCVDIGYILGFKAS